MDENNFSSLNEPLRIMVLISPTGLEERLKLIGKSRVPGEVAPEFELDCMVDSHGVKKTSK